jgi:hypothetical protein
MTPDTQLLRLALGILLFDDFTGAQQLAGAIVVRMAARPAIKPFRPFEKESGIYLFFDLPAGVYTIEVRSNRDGQLNELPPFYFPADLNITLPMPHSLWPAFPDLALADDTKPLDDPAQPAAYRTQRQTATLRPTAAYPFPAGATLVRGTVFAGAIPLSGATVRRTGSATGYTTAENGEFVLSFPNINGSSQTISLLATHPLHPDVNENVAVQRGMSTATNLIMLA